MRGAWCLALLLGGCLLQPAPSADPLALDEAAQAAMQRLVDDPFYELNSLSDPIPFGASSVEGPADWEALRDIPMEELLHEFELVLAMIRGSYFPEDMADEDARDGRPPSWRFKFLLEQEKDSFMPVELHWSRERGFSGHGYGAADGIMVCTPPDLGTLVTSAEAAQAAASVSAFAQHQQLFPEGEMWMELQYVDRQALAQASDGRHCLREYEPQWIMRWMDIDQLLKDEAPWVEVVLDAQDLTVAQTRQGVVKMASAYRNVVLFDEPHLFMSGANELLIGEVPPFSVNLHVTVRHPTVVVGPLEPGFELHSPSGQVYIDPNVIVHWDVYVPDPEPGVWTLVRTGDEVALTVPERRHIEAYVRV